MHNIKDKGYTLEKDYKENPSLRHSFNALAKKTFGIDFEPWYQGGFWNDRYVCVSYRFGNDIVANVSFSPMDLLLQGEDVPAIQIGTVMTHPDHRGQGLAQSLLEHVLDHHQSEAELFFLAADAAAVPLYSRLGFLPWQETRFSMNLDHVPRREDPLPSSFMTLEELHAWKRRALPVSTRLGVRNDEHVLLFYASLGYLSYARILDSETLVLFEVKEGTLHLYDVLSPKPFSLETLLLRIAPQSAHTVRIYFTPEEELPGLAALPDDSGGWMVFSPCGRTFPKKACFPLLAQT